MFTIIHTSKSNCVMSSKLVSQQHWYFDTTAFQPTGDQITLLLNILPHETRAKVAKFRALKDQKLSLISALMQRAMIRDTFACTDQDYTIKRTEFNKPFASSEKFTTMDWNYNVSHHGSHVTILSDATRPIGVDLVQRSVRAGWKQSASKYINQFTSQLTDAERAACLRHSHEWEQYTHFFVTWSLKEAYIKAVGKGLYMDLLSITFDVNFASLSSDKVIGSASAKIGGFETPDWEFTFSSIDKEHVVTVARGLGREAEAEAEKAEEAEEASSKVSTAVAPVRVQIMDLLSSCDQLKWKQSEVTAAEAELQ